MDRIQGRRRVNATVTQENDPLAARAAAKTLAKPRLESRTALGDLGNQARPALGAKSNVAKQKTTAAAGSQNAGIKPLATIHSVFGVPNEKKPLLKPSALKKQPVVGKPTTQVPAKRWQIKEAPAEEIKAGIPVLPRIQRKDIAKAFNAGKVIKRHTSSDSDDNETPKGLRDVDLEDDPQLVSEYVRDIMKYLLELEDKYPIPKNYLKDQKITEKHRAVLVNWLAEVAVSFKFLKETLHMSVALIDRYASLNRNITRESLQLVGMVAMFIAHKYEESMVITIDDWEYICDNAYTRDDIYRMELDMLKRINFTLGRPTAIAFLRRFNKVVNATLRQHALGKYLIELALLEYEFSAVKPSVQAAAACCLARWLTEVEDGKPEQGWNGFLAHYSGYKYADIRTMVARYAAMLVRAETSKHQTVRKIYSDDKLQRISEDAVLRSAKLKNLAALA